MESSSGSLNVLQERVLQNFDVPSLAAATNITDEDSERINRFRVRLIDQVLSQ